MIDHLCNYAPFLFVSNEEINYFGQLYNLPFPLKIVIFNRNMTLV